MNSDVAASLRKRIIGRYKARSDFDEEVYRLQMTEPKSVRNAVMAKKTPPKVIR